MGDETYTNASRHQRTRELWGVGCTSLAGGKLRIGIWIGIGRNLGRLIDFGCVGGGV